MRPWRQWPRWVWWTGGGVLAFLALRPGRVLARGPSASLVEIGHVTSPYGPRTLPGETEKFHKGIDISAPLGTEVRSVSAGKIVSVSPDGQRSGYGNTVILEHPDGTLTLYAHMLKFGPGIREGINVERGTVLGYVGQTHSPSTAYMAPHLHFEVLKNKVLWQGKVVVNPDTPARYEPQSWLRSAGVAVA